MDKHIKNMTYNELIEKVNEVNEAQLKTVNTDMILWHQLSRLLTILSTEVKRRATEGGCKDVAQKQFGIIL